MLWEADAKKRCKSGLLTLDRKNMEGSVRIVIVVVIVVVVVVVRGGGGGRWKGRGGR